MIARTYKHIVLCFWGKTKRYHEKEIQERWYTGPVNQEQIKQVCNIRTDGYFHLKIKQKNWEFLTDKDIHTSRDTKLEKGQCAHA